MTGDVDDAATNVPGNGSTTAGRSVALKLEGVEAADEIQFVWESDDGEQSADVTTDEFS